MKRIITLVFLLFIAFQSFAQTSDLNKYTYVIVPNQYAFQNEPDQYQLNSMTKFYLDKNGFNAFLASDSPNADRCDGLYADVEQLKTIFGTKLQVVLRDCNKKEIYRGLEGKSKFKDFEKSFQDALRKAFVGMASLNIKQEGMIALKDKDDGEKQNLKDELATIRSLDKNVNADLNLPSDTYSNYSAEGRSFLLRKMGEGYSLYEESAVAGDDLVLIGKIIILDKLVKFMDSSGQVNDAVFDNAETLTIGTGSSSKVYKQVKN